jgi:hypothetical protein
MDNLSTGLENPGKSLNWKKKFQDWKKIPAVPTLVILIKITE